MQEIMNFADKTVFVAGGSSGINLGIADAFAARGARLAIVSRSRERVDGAMRELEVHGGSIAGFVGDVRDVDAIAEVLAKVHERFGEIDVLISRAAGNFVAPVLGMSANGFRTVIDIDLNGTFNAWIQPVEATH